MTAEQLRSEFEKILSPAVNCNAPYAKVMVTMLIKTAETYAAHVREATQREIARLKQELEDEYSADRQIQEIAAKQEEECCQLVERAEAAERKLARYEALDAHLPPLYAIGDDATAELAVELVEVEHKLAEVEKAFDSLYKEVLGAVGFARPEIRKAIGNTNMTCLQYQLEKAEAALASLRAESKEG